MASKPLPRLAPGAGKDGQPAAPGTTVPDFQADATSPIAVSVAEGAKLIGVSRSLAYELMARGDLPYVSLGKRRLLLVSDLAGLLHRHRCRSPRA